MEQRANIVLLFMYIYMCVSSYLNIVGMIASIESLLSKCTLSCFVSVCAYEFVLSFC
jgi:hypothetical protein